MNLDRFSSPLDSERVNPYHMKQMIEEQQEENKKDLINEYLSWCWEEFSLVPDAEQVQEYFYKIDLDADMIKELIRRF